MNEVWKKIYDAARAVQGDRELNPMISAGCVAAAVESESGEIYVGVCVDTACSLGVCAERNAMFRMITAGESAIRRVLAIGDGGKAVAPCGACREFMAQLMPGRAGDVEILMDWENERIVTLRDLTPEWWL